MKLLFMIHFLLLMCLQLSASPSYRPRWNVSDTENRPIQVRIGKVDDLPRYLYHWTTLSILNQWKQLGPHQNLEILLHLTESTFHMVYERSLDKKPMLFLATDPVGGIGSAKIYPERFGVMDVHEPRVLLRIEVNPSLHKSEVLDLEEVGASGPRNHIPQLMQYDRAIPALQNAPLVRHMFHDAQGDMIFKEWVLLDPSAIKSVEISPTSSELQALLRDRLELVKSGNLKKIDAHYKGGIFTDPEGKDLIVFTLEQSLKLKADDLAASLKVNFGNWEHGTCSQLFAN